MIVTILFAVVCLLLCGALVVLLLLMRKKQMECQNKQEHFIHHDRLTGLANQEALKRDFAALKKRESLAMVSIKLNRFQDLYSLFGLVMGDKMLKRFCRPLENYAKEREGTAYRFAFNHMIILVPAEDHDAFLSSLKTFLSVLQQVKIEEKGIPYSYYFSLSYGVYFLSDKEDGNATLESIMDYINTALRAGFSHIVLDKQDKPDWSVYESLAHDVKSAWKNREFVPYYQPIYNLQTGAIVGAEVLSRWQHPTRGLLMPAQFIPVLDSMGNTCELDFYMVEEACKKIQSWLDDGILTVPITVNLSKMNLHRPDFTERIVALVRQYNIPPVLLELELPERTVLFEESDHFVEMMNDLHRHGFTLSMDKFAADDAFAVGLLRQLPLDAIKMDYHFFETRRENKSEELFIRAFLELTKALGIKVIVVNIETEAQANTVRRYGCENGKGYYFSKPISNKEFEALIN